MANTKPDPPPKFWKDPNDKLDYPIDFTDLLAEDETLTTIAWSVAFNKSGELIASDDMLIIDEGASVLASPLAIVWVEGGTLTKQYWVTATSDTNQGRRYDRSIIIIPIER